MRKISLKALGIYNRIRWILKRKPFNAGIYRFKDKWVIPTTDWLGEGNFFEMYPVYSYSIDDFNSVLETLRDLKKAKMPVVNNYEPLEKGQLSVLMKATGAKNQWAITKNSYCWLIYEEANSTYTIELYPRKKKTPILQNSFETYEECEELMKDYSDYEF